VKKLYLKTEELSTPATSSDPRNKAGRPVFDAANVEAATALSVAYVVNDESLTFF